MERDTCDEPLMYVGPDPLALVMAVEEKFNIIIPDEDAEKILSMGQLYDYVFARVARGQAQVCFTSATFYRLRRALGEVCRVPRERIRPQARLEDLISLNDRARYWRELQDRLGGLYLPRLRRPAWLVKWIEAASCIPLFLSVPIVLLILLLGQHGDMPSALATVGIAALASCFIGFFGGALVRRELCRRTEHYTVDFPLACATVRDLVYTLVSGHHAPHLVSDTERANDREIWGALCAIVGGEFDRRPDSFTRKSTFV